MITGGLHSKSKPSKSKGSTNNSRQITNNHSKKISYQSSTTENQGENIYDSKINEERPKINKSLGKHQINNNLHMWTKMGVKIYKDDQPHLSHLTKEHELMRRPPNARNLDQSGMTTGSTVKREF